MAEKLMLIDGHSILNRAFYGVPDLTNSEGIHTNALFGFLNIMFKYLDEETPDYIAVAFDLNSPTFRHKSYEGYKGTRKPMVPELKQQVPLIKELLSAMNITILSMEGFEADDILGTIAKRTASKGIDVSIISGDRDLLQLSDNNIKIRIPKTKKGVTETEDYYPEDVKELYGVTPIEFIDMKALMGDTSDNIPGAPGIGPKTASALIQKYGNVEAIFEDIDNVKPPKAKLSISENIEQVRMSRFLAEIKIDVPIEFDISKSKAGDYFNQNSYVYFKRFNFKNMLKRFDNNQVKQESDIYKNFICVSDFSEMENIFSEAKNAINKDSFIGISVVFEEYLLGVSIAFSEDKIYYISVEGLVTPEYLKGKLTELIELSNNGNIAISNLKKLMEVISDDSWKAIGFTDVAVAAYLLKPNNDNYDYDILASDYLNILVQSRNELVGKQSLRMLNEIDSNTLVKMACTDSYVNYACSRVLVSKLKEEKMYNLFRDIEMPLVFVLSSMEKEGICANITQLQVLSKEFGERISELEKSIYDDAGEEFNINSPKQLGEILFEKMNMEPKGKKTKSGYSTAADVLEKLADKYTIVSKILEYRQVSKLKSTYADGLVPFIKEDGRIHCHFNQTITATGRISCTDPNLQNIPIRMESGRQLRKVFEAKEGSVFIDADYSQIELRILAHMSGDESLISAYKNAQDIHRTTASQVFKVPFEDVTDQMRRNAKAVNFGIIYGISSFGLSQDLSISKKEAKEYIDRYFETYPSIKNYIDGLVENAKETGYSLTMYNRRRDIPELKSSNFMQRSFGERVAMNAPIQGTAADIIKLAMIRTYEGLKNANLKAKLILQVHDELLIETPEDEVEEVKRIVADSMKNAANLLVPLEIDLKVGKTWFEAH